MTFEHRTVREEAPATEPFVEALDTQEENAAADELRNCISGPSSDKLTNKKQVTNDRLTKIQESGTDQTSRTAD